MDKRRDCTKPEEVVPGQILRTKFSRRVNLGWFIAGTDLFGALDNRRLRGWRPRPFELDIFSLSKEIQFLFCGTDAAALYALDDFVPVLLVLSPTKERLEVASKWHFYRLCSLGGLFLQRGPITK